MSKRDLQTSTFCESCRSQPFCFSASSREPAFLFSGQKTARASIAISVLCIWGFGDLRARERVAGEVQQSVFFYRCWPTCSLSLSLSCPPRFVIVTKKRTQLLLSLHTTITSNRSPRNIFCHASAGIISVAQPEERAPTAHTYTCWPERLEVSFSTPSLPLSPSSLILWRILEPAGRHPRPSSAPSLCFAPFHLSAPPPPPSPPTPPD